jgi:hypothetical protein
MKNPMENSTGSQRPEKSELYPWYDSIWLNNYSNAKDYLARGKPEKLKRFIDEMQTFRTKPNFAVKHLKQVLDDATFSRLLQEVRALKPADFKLHEVHRFRRFVVHDHPYFTQLQAELTEFVSHAAGEALEPNYNFLSLYSSTGVCPVHIDSPEAKWTLDLCLAQSEPWPIHLSRVVPWPEADANAPHEQLRDPHWAEAIKNDLSLEFRPYTMQPGEALLFSGSSQWHYREALPAQSKNSFCDLLFFHYIPRGTAKLVRAENWPAYFDEPELPIGGNQKTSVKLGATASTSPTAEA